LQTGTVRFLRPLGGTSPVEWRITGEFYNFRTRPPRNVSVVAVLDESTYEGGDMGPDHPISWCRRVQGGRSWYTGLGHRPELYLDEVFLAHLVKGLHYVLSQSEEC
jgi:type 1 glutamine amidotransferase